MDQIRPVTEQKRSFPLTPRRNHLGVTVVELMVACLILGMLSAMIFFTLQTSRAAQKKLDAADTVRRSHLIARLHIADLLRGARMETPNADAPESPTLSFQKPLLIGDVLQVDVLGNQLWTDFMQISMNTEGHLIATSAEGPQVLANLGAGATFKAQALVRKVRVSLTSPEQNGHPALTTQADYFIVAEVSPGEP